MVKLGGKPGGGGGGEVQEISTGLILRKIINAKLV